MNRISKVQKEILLRLINGVFNGIQRVKSTHLNAAVNRKLGKTIHPNNFRTSCETLAERGLIVRTKEDFDWHINLTPEGFDKASEWLELVDSSL
ncbi:hypothetical protein BOO93_14450 [Vibrio navarrensis]|nr:hypothetical protein [Vibrio sp. S234-5]KJR35931.1 hypothetical protein UF06_04710 [Vibrio sp. S234-5]MBE3653844.1 hypothetical protein [Vibrio navarrensis]